MLNDVTSILANGVLKTRAKMLKEPDSHFAPLLICNLSLVIWIYYT